MAMHQIGSCIAIKRQGGAMSVSEVQAKVQRILIETLGSAQMVGDGSFVLEFESATGFVNVIDWGDGDTIVKVSSPMLTNVPLTSEVYQWVAIEGQTSWFAHARVIPSDDPSIGMIVWEHDLLGNFLDPDELTHSIRAVMIGANKHDDDLQARFGGDRAID